jgi:uncharacterized membrane protein
MNITQSLTTLILIAIVLIPIDYVYLSSFSKYFAKVFHKIQGKKLELNIWGALLCYILIVLSIFYFGFIKKISVFDMFIFGFLTYGIYETTNYATLQHWPIFMVFLDTLWGGILYSSSFYFVKLLIKQQ